jgi:hypothetical protein
MESLFSLPLPFQRRLTKMYTDTKSSYDFVKEPVQSAEDPELVSLHRKLRIQKDRLVSWGLEWSDPSQSPDIDESINRAGLAELVGSVMSTIKDILAEAEPLWQSSRRAELEKGPASEKTIMDRKAPLIVWDKSRFQDLVRDLTMSIDTLYDLSRTRQSARKPQILKTSESSSSMLAKTRAEERLFESTRMQTPQQIDPKTLVWPRDLKSIQSGMLPPAKFSRQIVFIRRPNTGSRKHAGQSSPLIPVLMEYSPYDPIYSITGITPSMSRFEKLFAALSQAYLSSSRMLSGFMHLIGYFEEAEHSRFCLLFSLPSHFGPVDIESPRMPSITILSDLLFSQNFEPSLEVKYRLANNVASAVFDLHSKGVVHGNISASNVLFLEPQSHSRLDLSQVNMRQSYLVSFDLFSDNATDTSGPSSISGSPYRHSLDPRITRYTHFTSDSKSLDLYSLALLLLEIGLWNPLQDIFPGSSQIPENPVEVLKHLAVRCGSLYVKAVQACWHAPEEELSRKARPDVMHQKAFFKVSKALETCCALDDSSDEEIEDFEEPPVAQSIPIIPSTPTSTSQPASYQRKTFSDTKPLVTSLSSGHSPSLRSPNPEKSPYTSPYAKSPSSFPEKMGWTNKPLPPKPSSKYNQPLQSYSNSHHLTTVAPMQKIEKPKSTLRTYPSIRIAQEHLDFWQTGLIPHINHVLRNFYRKYPESVEISLESIGESPTTTKPTILVICTSVNKVRSILKKSLVYDKSVFGLKVCRGKVVRSRKHGARRSMANDTGEVKAANGHHQERPLNGASIGAYVRDRNLPPVSFGGLITVDDKTYGMTVHHMLDDPSDSEDDGIGSQVPILRSSAHQLDMPDLTLSESSVYSSGDEEYMYSLSDYESDFSSDNESEFDEDDEYPYDENNEEMEPGDIRGIPQGCGEEYLITQPAIDDVDDNFYPSDETRDEDHVDSFQLGELYASSGIRRRTEGSVIHEIDWALFEFSQDRQPESNHILNGDRFCHQKSATYPISIAPVQALGGMNVHCMGRTSGLQSGRILPGLVVVKIFGRQTPSSSYQVAGKLGIPGDSGAWVVDNEMGKACGHVLAWSTRKKVAYICPMDVMVRDIAETLRARSLKLPGGAELLRQNLSTSNSMVGSMPMSNLNAATKNDPSNVEDELASLLLELKLPPTPERVDSSPIPPVSTSAQQYSLTSSLSSPPMSSPACLEATKNFVPMRLMTCNAEEQKTASMPRHQHIPFVKETRMSWQDNEDIGPDSVGEGDSLALVGVPSGSGSGLGIGIGNGLRRDEQLGPNPGAGISVGVKRTPPPPPPRRGEIRAGI